MWSCVFTNKTPAPTPAAQKTQTLQGFVTPLQLTGDNNLTRCQQSHAPVSRSRPGLIPGLASLPPAPVGIPQPEPGSPLGSSAVAGPCFHPALQQT